MANIDTLGEFRRYTPKELAEIDGRLRDAEQSIENTFTGLDIKRVKRVKKSKENMEAELDAIKMTPMKDANGEPIKDAKNRTLTLMDVLAKRGLTTIKLPDEETQTQAPLLLPKAIAESPYNPLDNMDEEVMATGKIEELTAEASDKQDESKAEIYDDIPLNYEVNEKYGEGEDIGKWFLILKDIDDPNIIYGQVSASYKTIQKLEEILNNQEPNKFKPLESNKQVLGLFKKLVKNCFEYIKEGVGVPVKIRITPSFNLVITKSGKIEEERLKQEGKGIRRRYKGHSKAPQNKPLTIQIIDETKGKLGNKYINMAQLLYYKHLIISDIDGNKFYDASISPGLLKLLTKKTVAPNRNNKYIDKDLKEFAKILRICDVIPTAAEKRSAKWRLIEDITEPAKFNTRARLEEETDKMLGEGLNTDSFDDNIEYISRGIQARNAGNSSKYLKLATIKKISKLFGNGIINSDEKYNLLEQLA